MFVAAWFSERLHGCTTFDGSAVETSDHFSREPKERQLQQDPTYDPV